MCIIHVTPCVERACNSVLMAGVITTDISHASPMRSVNVEGTQNVIKACVANKVSRLVRMEQCAYFP